jgi:hypothetical protein
VQNGLHLRAIIGLVEFKVRIGNPLAVHPPCPPQPRYAMHTATTPGERTFFAPVSTFHAGRDFSVSSLNDEIPRQSPYGQGPVPTAQPIDVWVPYRSSRVVSRHLTSLHFLRCCPDIGEALTTHAALRDHAILPAVGESIGTLTVRDDSGVERASKAVNELVSIPRRPSSMLGGPSFPYPVQI